MKKYLLIILGLIIPAISFANITIPWFATSTTQGWMFPEKVNGVEQVVFGQNFFATSTSASSTLQNTNVFGLLKAFLQSAADTTTNFISLFHDGSDGTVSTGKGSLYLRPNSATVYVNGNIMPTLDDNGDIGATAAQFSNFHLRRGFFDSTQSEGTNGKVLLSLGPTNGTQWTATSSLGLSIVTPVSIANGGTNNTSFINPTLIAFDGTRLVSTTTDPLIVGSIKSTTTNFSYITGQTGISSSTPWGMLAVDKALGAVSLSAPFFTVGTVANPNPYLIVDDSGRVGVGTSTQSKLFEVRGNALLGTNSGTSTVEHNLEVLKNLKIGNSSIMIRSAATSTFDAGINTTAGCYAINGTCLSGGPATPVSIANGGTATTTFYNGGTIFYNSSLGTLSQSSAQANYFWDESTKRLGLGTSTPLGLLSINPNGITGPSFVVGSSTKTDLVVTNGGDILFGTSTRLGYSTSTLGDYNFSVDKRTSVFNAGAGGTLGGWATVYNSGLSARRNFVTVYANGYIYAVSGSDGTSNPRTFSTKVNSDGSLRTWVLANTTQACGNDYIVAGVTTANGYLYILGGSKVSDGSRVATVCYSKIYNDGTISDWSTNPNSLPDTRDRLSSVAVNNYIYAIGGRDSTGAATTTVYYANLNADGSTGAWNKTTTLPAVNALHASVVANGYLYVLGGRNTGGTGQTTVYFSKFNADGTLGAWTTSGSVLPTKVAESAAGVSNGYLYLAGGSTGSGGPPTGPGQTTLYYAKINANGTVNPWATSTVLPQAVYAHASILVNGYFYVIDGVDAAGNLLNTTYYASTPRVLINGALDLQGLASSTLASFGDLGRAGSPLLAGDIFSNGRLEVAGGVGLYGGLKVSNLFSLTASTSVNQAYPIFSIQNATSTNPLFTVNYDGNMGMATTSGAGRLTLQATTTAGQADIFEVASALGASIFRIASTGNVGAGTSTPSATVAIAGVTGTTPFYIATSTAVAASTTLFRIGQDGAVQLGGGTPTVTCGIGTCAFDAHSNDQAGTVNTSGVVTSVVITFSTPKPWPPHCVVSDSSTAITPGVTKTTTALTINFSASLGTGSVDYICVQ